MPRPFQKKEPEHVHDRTLRVSNETHARIRKLSIERQARIPDTATVDGTLRILLDHYERATTGATSVDGTEHVHVDACAAGGT